MVRPLLAGLATLLIAGAPAEAGTLTKRVGTTWTVEFPGNPGTGYTWHYAPDVSRGRSAVKVVDRGYASADGGLVGAPAAYRFRLSCLSAGDARLAFDYVPPGDRPAEDRLWIKVRCR